MMRVSRGQHANHPSHGRIPTKIHWYIYHDVPCNLDVGLHITFTFFVLGRDDGCHGQHAMYGTSNVM